MNNMKILLATTVFMLTISSLVQAQSVYQCLDNITLQKSYNYSFTMDANNVSNNMNMSVVKQTDCQFGCDNVTNVCSPDPATLIMWFGGVMLGLLLIIGVIVRIWRGY